MVRENEGVIVLMTSSFFRIMQLRRKRRADKMLIINNKILHAFFSFYILYTLFVFGKPLIYCLAKLLTSKIVAIMYIINFYKFFFTEQRGIVAVKIFS